MYKDKQVVLSLGESAQALSLSDRKIAAYLFVSTTLISTRSVILQTDAEDKHFCLPLQ